ncbi:major facilitator superfamily domain-containing protein [Rhypophila decipiens]|uniref:Major facilitator superfamily domain-containing protein n=1 Tax=Rhypophila decipiens TaxID=261697 RepID=A0AAN6YB93_9PEZI|nr:major facilitator superfamily domain-containing protein [Rhypophila decipiens]
MDDAESRPLLWRARAQDAISTPSINTRRRTRLLILICISIVAADFAILLSKAPQLSILESQVCEDHRNTTKIKGKVKTLPIWTPTVPIDSIIHFNVAPNDSDTQQPEQDFCKSDIVQGELAILTGWKETFDTIPGIILALPYGYAADRYGRQPILLLSLLGVILEGIFERLIIWWHSGGLGELRSLWWVPLCQFIGGGPQVASSMAYAMISDLCPSEKRASVFFLIGAALIMSEVLAGPLSAAMMTYWDPWFPLLTGSFLQLIAFFTAALLPETMPSPDPETVPLISLLDHQDEEEEEEQDDTIPLMDWKQVYSNITTYHADIKALLLNRNVSSLVFSVLFASVARQAVQLIVQYASKRFNWTIALSSCIVAFKALVNLVMLCYLLPKIAKALLVKRRYNLSVVQKDHAVTRYSVWFLAFGALMMGMSGPISGVFISGVGVLALGWGYFAAVRSLALGVVSSNEIGLMSSLLGWATSIGTMVAGSTMAVLFEKGLEMGGLWIGLPYLVAGGLFTGAAVAVTFGVRDFRVDLISWGDEEDDDDVGIVTDVAGSTGILIDV